MKVLSFDMGLRNLAFCLADVSGSVFTIEAWNNYDLLAGSDSQTASRCSCGGPPSWQDGDVLLCKRCVKAKKVAKACFPGTSLAVKGLKELATAENWVVPKKPKKEDYMKLVMEKYMLPYVKPKNTMKTDLTVIFGAIEKFLDVHLGLFSAAAVIRIENQPVFDAPTMKSVQIMLFSLLLHRLRAEKSWPGQIVFVHASKKTEEAASAVDEAGGDYKARKDVAESLVLQKVKEGPWREFFLSKKKKSDLADAFLMCLRS
jgi:Mitochondrial resolvase Ydc2 / RNA splicing MRS1